MLSDVEMKTKEFHEKTHKTPSIIALANKVCNRLTGEI